MGEHDEKIKEAEIKLSALELYNRDNRSPLKLIALVTLVLLAVVWGVVVWVQGVGLKEVFSTEWIKAYSTRWFYERHFFILYACGFVAWWVVYFGSRKQGATGEESLYKRVKTLRRLLGECSVQWGSADQITPENLDRMEAGFRNKAQSSMTTIDPGCGVRTGTSGSVEAAGASASGPDRG